jgi:hypothetical protein
MAWSTAVSMVLVACLLFGAAYIGLSAIGRLPSSMKNFVTYIQSNIDIFAFCFCVTIGAYVVLKVFPSKPQSSRSKQYD